jgi:hypothetical protein
VDGNICTLDHCDGSGACVSPRRWSCDDGIACTQDTCDPVDGCVYTGEPATTCQSPAKASLDVKDNAVDTRDLVKFTWKGGPVLVAALGDPTATTGYELCVYDANGVRFGLSVPPGFTPPRGPGWKVLGTTFSPKGYRYKDAAASNQGVKDVKLLASSLNRASSSWSARVYSCPTTRRRRTCCP